MAEHDDFASLYRELGIHGACTPEALRRAYRRRVSQLHPDQRGRQGDVAQLQELNRLYDAALDFLRTHGRLPGSAVPGVHDTHLPHAPAAPSAAGKATAPAAPSAHTAWPDTTMAAEAPAGSGRLSRYFVLLAVLAIAALAASALKGTISVHQDTPRDTGAIPPQADARVDTGDIALGMGKRRVLSIQGAPVGEHDIRWDYGPSWIDFKCGDVVTDWYSSPLRPLRTASPHPTPGDWDRFDAARPPGC